MCVLIKEEVNDYRIDVSVNEKYQTLPPIESLWISLKIGFTRFFESSFYRHHFSTEDVDQMMLNSIEESLQGRYYVHLKNGGLQLPIHKLEKSIFVQSRYE